MILLGLIWIIFASVQDLKSREVSNWLNFSLVVFALGIRFFYSLFEANDFVFFYQGLIGLGVFLVLGNLFYYGRLFGGGDAKLMIALGAVLPLSLVWESNLNIFIWFLALFLIVGSFYGLVWSVVLTFINFNSFKIKFLKLVDKNRKKIIYFSIGGIGILFLGFVDVIFLLLGVMFLFLPYFYLYAKSVDDSCMIKEVKSVNLTEGDLLYKAVKAGKDRITPNWEGLSTMDIKKIRKFKKFILVRQGIPFVPVFLISYFILFYLYFNGFLLNFNSWLF